MTDVSAELTVLQNAVTGLTTGAQGFVAQSQAARDASETAKDDAQTARGQAQAAEQGAVAAQGQSETARDASIAQAATALTSAAIANRAEAAVTTAEQSLVPLLNSAAPAPLAGQLHLMRNPTLTRESLALAVDVPAGFYQLGSVGERSSRIYPDLNAVPGIPGALKATGFHAPVVGRNGRRQFQIHNFTPKTDWSDAAVTGTARAFYGALQGLAWDGSPNTATVSETINLPAQTVITWEITAKGVAGEITTFTITAGGSGGTAPVSVSHTFDGTNEDIALTMTLSGPATSLSFSIGSESPTDTADAINHANSWGRMTSYGPGKIATQNIAGFTHKTVPHDLVYGAGITHDPITGKPRHIATAGTAYENSVQFEDASTNNFFVQSITQGGVTCTLLDRHFDADGLLVVQIRCVGTLTASSCHGGFDANATRTEANPDETWTGEVTARLVSGTSPSGGVSFGVFGISPAPDYAYIDGSLDPTDGGGVLTPEWRRIIVTETLSYEGVGAVRTQGRIIGEVGEAIDCVIAYKAGQLSQSDFVRPYIPVVPGGLSVASAQPFMAEAIHLFPLETNKYAALGLDGQITWTVPDQETWHSSTGEGRISIDKASGDITVSAGTSAELISLDAGRFGYSDDDVIKVALTYTPGANPFAIQTWDGTTWGNVINPSSIPANTPRTIEFQAVVSGGVVFRVNDIGVVGSGFVSGISIKKVAASRVSAAARFLPLTDDYTANATLLTLSDGSLDNYYRLLIGLADDNLRVRSGAGGVIAFDRSGAETLPPNGEAALALSIGDTDYTFAFSSEAPVTTPYSATIAPIQYLTLNTAEPGIVVDGGLLSALSVFSDALPAADLTALTTV